MREDDEFRLRHMLDAAVEAVSFVEDCERADLSGNRPLLLALVKSIEIVGEAATQVSKPTRSELEQIPWREIVSMRNRLVHGYFQIDLDVVWNTVQQDLPRLIVQLEQVIPANR